MFKGIIQFTQSVSQKNKSLEDVLLILSKKIPEATFTFLGNDWDGHELEYKVTVYDKTKDMNGDWGYTCKYHTQSKLTTYNSSFSNSKKTLYTSLSKYMKSAWFKERKWVTAHLKDFFGVEVDFNEDSIFDRH